MRLYIISFTRTGASLSKSLAKLCEKKHQCNLYSTKPYDTSISVASVKEFTQQAFEKADGIIFVGACGIAVRSIAPYLKHKGEDPAVVVLDEKGKFAISLLSGHRGGANALARELAGYTKGQAVITTATDVQEKTAVDVWAKQQGLWFDDWNRAKKISIAVLEGQKISVFSDFPIFSLPEEFCESEIGDLGICISFDERKKPFGETLLLIPQIVVVGIGCKKGTEAKEIEKFLFEVLEEKAISHHSICCICSIDLKQEEKGILQVCNQYGWEFCTYSAEELEKAKGSFSSSDFVKHITGVDNVCERSAVLGSQGGILLHKKIARDGITLAIAVKQWGVGIGV